MIVMPIKVANGGCSVASGFISGIMVTPWSRRLRRRHERLGGIRELIAERAEGVYGRYTFNKSQPRKDTAGVRTGGVFSDEWKR
ncbi:MAG TPA: hypothetical protein VF778_04600 [Xanthobacteraceae bacterium]